MKLTLLSELPDPSILNPSLLDQEAGSTLASRLGPSFVYIKSLPGFALSPTARVNSGRPLE